jgi:hypothetical protein
VFEQIVCMTDSMIALSVIVITTRDIRKGKVEALDGTAGSGFDTLIQKMWFIHAF